ncbi:MAG: hypothetical protein ACTHMA_05075 [Thermomicrobiales bacterium]
MSWRYLIVVSLIALALLAACGPASPTVTPAANPAPTQTRVAELAQLATLTAPTAVPTANRVPTQTRAAELAQLATLTAPTPTTVPTAPVPTRTAPPATPATPATTALNRTFVARLAGSDAFVGISISGDSVMAYVCDGASLAQWFTGTVQGDQLDLSSADGKRLTAQLSTRTDGSRSATGLFKASSGDQHEFSTTATTGLDRAGLYRGTGVANSVNLVVGVIVLPDGDLRGVIRVGQQLTPVTNPTYSVNGLIVTDPTLGTLTAQRLGTP